MILIENLLQVLTVIITVIQRNCNTLSTEATRASNPMQVVLCVSNSLSSILAYSLGGHIEVDDDLDLWHVNASRQHVSCDHDANLSRPKLLNHLISLLMAHLTENDSGF